MLLSTFWYMPQLAFIIFISLLLQLLLLPLTNKLAEKMPRALAAGLILLCFISLALLLLMLVSKSFIPTFSRFVTDFPQITEKVQSIAWLQESDFLQSELDDIWAEMKNALRDLLSAKRWRTDKKLSGRPFSHAGLPAGHAAL